MGLFQKKVDPRCGYCALGREGAEGQVICPKKGIMDASSHCRSFRYDPLRRTPPRPVSANFDGLKDEDFQL